MDHAQELETWEINDRLNLFFLDNTPPESLTAKVEKSKTVTGHFAHIHNVRLMWLKASAPELMAGLEKVEGDPSVEILKTNLTASGIAMRAFLAQSFATGKAKGFKPHPAAFLGYLIAHEAFHRSQAELVLRQVGTPLSDKVAYGLWEWGVR